MEKFKVIILIFSLFLISGCFSDNRDFKEEQENQKEAAQKDKKDFIREEESKIEKSGTVKEEKIPFKTKYKFEDFKVEVEEIKEPYVKPNFDNYQPFAKETRVAEEETAQIPNPKTYYTVISNSVEKGPNFAGSYRFVSVGCGSNCAFSYVVNGKNGKIIGGPFSGFGFDYKIDSNLLIVQPAGEDGYYNCYESGYCQPEIYLFKNERFEKLWPKVSKKQAINEVKKLKEVQEWLNNSENETFLDVTIHSDNYWLVEAKNLVNSSHISYHGRYYIDKETGKIWENKDPLLEEHCSCEESFEKPIKIEFEGEIISRPAGGEDLAVKNLDKNSKYQKLYVNANGNYHEEENKVKIKGEVIGVTCAYYNTIFHECAFEVEMEPIE